MAVENKRVIGGHILRKAPPPPCFCVCRGNKGVTGEWLASRGNKGVSWRKSEEEAKSVRPFARIALGKGAGREVCVPDGVPGRSEMAQEQRPLSITNGA